MPKTATIRTTRVIIVDTTAAIAVIAQTI